MGKGEQTRAQIIEHALELAKIVGLEGLSLGTLAESANLSKSGLFAHFKSKEALQLEVLETAVVLVTNEVIRPALAQPRGEARLRALFENYLRWIKGGASSGCIFTALSHEYDDRPGAVRDRLVKALKDLHNVFTRVAKAASDAGYLRPDLDAEQFAFDFIGLMKAYEYNFKLLADAKAEDKARTAFEALIYRNQPQNWPAIEKA